MVCISPSSRISAKSELKHRERKTRRQQLCGIPRLGVTFHSYHQPTPDDEQNGGEDQSQDPIRDTDCHPGTDNDTGYGTRQQRAENADIVLYPELRTPVLSDLTSRML